MILKVNFKFPLKHKEKIIISILLIFVFIFNTIAFTFTFDQSKNPLNDNFSMSSSGVLNIPSDPSEQFEVFNHSVFSFNTNNGNIIDFNFDSNFSSLINYSFYQVNYTKSFPEFVMVKFTTNGIQSLLLQEFQSNETNPGNPQPKIAVLTKSNTNKNVFNVQSILKVSCSIPNYYTKNYYADLCYTRDIQFLNTTTLLLLQTYTNQHNPRGGWKDNNYGSSLIFYNINTNSITKTILLTNPEAPDYDYLSIRNANNVFLHFDNSPFNGKGFDNLNIITGKINKFLSSNLEPIYKYGYQSANIPLIINSKILMFYINGNTMLKRFALYNINSQTGGFVYNFLIYALIIISVVVLLREKVLKLLYKVKFHKD